MDQRPGHWAEIEHVDGMTVLNLEGEIDLDSHTAVTRATLPLTRSGRPIVVDMSKVTFLDSAGIAFLLALRNAAVENGTPLMVRNASEPVRRAVGTVDGSLSFLTTPPPAAGAAS
jgi:anti-anti-sigma factor